LSKEKESRSVYAAITIIAIGCLPCLTFFNQVVFLNRTASMPTGIYLKNNRSELDVGSIIVFKSVNKKGNLIKYIAGREGDEVCLDFENTLWVNGLPLTQKNIEKYPEETPSQSVCQSLKRDELLALGEHPDSYDSRYFGPIHRQQVIARVELFIYFKPN
jgi:signal peptidase I